MLFQTITLSIVFASIILSKFIVDKDLQGSLLVNSFFINRNSRKYLYDFLLLH